MKSELSIGYESAWGVSVEQPTLELVYHHNKDVWDRISARFRAAAMALPPPSPPRPRALFEDSLTAGFTVLRDSTRLHDVYLHTSGLYVWMPADALAVYEDQAILTMAAAVNDAVALGNVGEHVITLSHVTPIGWLAACTPVNQPIRPAAKEDELDEEEDNFASSWASSTWD